MALLKKDKIAVVVITIVLLPLAGMWVAYAIMQDQANEESHANWYNTQFLPKEFDGTIRYLDIDVMYPCSYLITIKDTIGLNVSYYLNTECEGGEVREFLSEGDRITKHSDEPNLIVTKASGEKRVFKMSIDKIHN